MNDPINNDNGELKKKFDSLPEKIQDIIYSDVTLKKVASIGEKYNLHVDKIEDLQFATEDVMGGDIRADGFIPHIVKELKIDQETANKIGTEIDQQIFESVRDAIKSLSEPKKEEKETDIVKSEPIPVVKEEIKPTIADIKTKQITSSPVQESSYSLDPYREPIE